MRRVRPSRTTGVTGFLGTCPSAVIISGGGTFTVVRGFFSLSLRNRRVVMSGNKALSLKGRGLAFMFTPVIR